MSEQHMTDDEQKRRKSVFADNSVWTYRYAVTLHVESISGGTPSDPKIAKAWLEAKLGSRDAVLAQKVIETLGERSGADTNASPEEIIDKAMEDTAINVNGFKRLPNKGGLYIEGRIIKAMVKENTSIGLGSGVVPSRLGLTKKGAPSFVAEHVQVVDDVVPLLRDGKPIIEADEVVQSFVHTWRGSGFSYTETVYDADVSFTLSADLDLTDLWPKVFSLAELNGLGSRRSQGSGRFTTTKFDKI
jgi:hypothetical protein